MYSVSDLQLRPDLNGKSRTKVCLVEACLPQIWKLQRIAPKSLAKAEDVFLSSIH